LLKAVNQLFSQRKSSLSFFLIAYIRWEATKIIIGL
jgi:hypothetical protein